MFEDQRALLRDAVSRFVSRGAPYSLVDFPAHSNIGDSAIWLGEAKLLKSVTGRHPDHVCAYTNYSHDLLAKVDGPIFAHGGGNLGDLWPWHQDFRERLLTEFRDRPIIQLPQTIHFTDDASIERYAKLVADHPDYHLMVRDEPSLAFAQKHLSCETTLVPDSAIFLDLEPVGEPIHETLLLLREDKERANGHYSLRMLGHVEDWPAEDNKKIIRLWDHAERSGRPIFYNGTAQLRVKRGVEILSSGQNVITDRLHGHILAAMLGIKHYLVDNSYGKLSAYHQSWMQGTAGWIAGPEL